MMLSMLKAQLVMDWSQTVSVLCECLSFDLILISYSGLFSLLMLEIIPLTTMSNPSQSATPTVMIMMPTTDNWQIILLIAVPVAKTAISVTIVAGVTLCRLLRISKHLPDDFLLYTVIIG